MFSAIETFLRQWKWALVGGFMGASLAAAGIMAVGRVGGAEGRVLLEAILPSIRFLASGVLAASATILALMLTALSITNAADTEMERRHYREMEQIGWLTTVTLVVAVMGLGLTSVPITESESVDGNLYRYLYMGAMIFSAFLTASFITVCIMLNISLRRLITVLSPDFRDD